MTTVDDIKPCPFCGEIPAIVLDDYINGRIIVDPDFFIECENPDCLVGPRVCGKYTDFDNIVAAWNRRASLTPQEPK